MSEPPTPTWTGPLRDALQPITAALRQLVECPEVFRPFVVIKSDDDPFVQFAGSTERGVLFDVPALHIVTQPCASPEAGATLAVRTLHDMGVLGDTPVHVTFDSTRGGPGFRTGSA
jgi:hypothetical protein